MSTRPSLCLTLALFLAVTHAGAHTGSPAVTSRPSWIINAPKQFQHQRHQQAANTSSNVESDTRDLNTLQLFLSEQYRERHTPTGGFTDGETIDALEHFFWPSSSLNHIGGLALELGALDGTNATHSMTFPLEETFGWTRILIEGNPSYADSLRIKAPNAFSVSAAICVREGKVRYSSKEYVGGILEFMSPAFLKAYHPEMYTACTNTNINTNININRASDRVSVSESESVSESVSRGLLERKKATKGVGVSAAVSATTACDLTRVDWSQEAVRGLAKEIDCVPLSAVLKRAHARHVNLFILDVEGGELNVLQSIDFTYTRFDVLCVETDPKNRPRGYREALTSLLASHGYVDHTGQKGRNTWYVHKSFTPSAKPGLSPGCFNGARRSKAGDIDCRKGTHTHTDTDTDTDSLKNSWIGRGFTYGYSLHLLAAAFLVVAACRFSSSSPLVRRLTGTRFC